MKILAVSSYIPYPPIDGGRMGIYFPLRELARRGNEITFACLSEPVDPSRSAHMREWCRLIVVEHKKKATISGAAKSLLSYYPYALSRFHDRRLVEAVLAERDTRWDIIEVEGMHNAFNGLMLSDRLNLPAVLRLHNAEAVILDRYKNHTRNPLLRMFLTVDAWRLRQFEKRVAHRFSYMVPVSARDGDLVREHAPGLRMRVIQSGVDVERPLLTGIEVDPLAIAWMGSLNWPPNVDSLEWFITDVFPLVRRLEPGATLHVMGSNAPADFMIPKAPNVRFLGFVEDTRTVLQRCPVAVVPLRSGGGIRLKILELLALQRAVVSTSVGCEGLAVEPGKHLVVADDPKQFADSIVTLLHDPDRARALGDRGRALVSRLYSWQKIGEDFDHLYKEILQESTQAAVQDR